MLLHGSDGSTGAGLDNPPRYLIPTIVLGTLDDAVVGALKDLSRVARHKVKRALCVRLHSKEIPVTSFRKAKHT